MKFVLSLLSAIFFLSALQAQTTLQSPNHTLTLSFTLASNGTPEYRLDRGSKHVILPSRLGLELKGEPSLMKGFTVTAIDSMLVDTVWEPVLGEVKTIRNNYRELRVTLSEHTTAPRVMRIVFRLFDEGLAFRYEFPIQPHLGYFTVADERTEFHLSGDHKAFWIPGDFDTNEYEYHETPLSKVDAFEGMSETEIATRHVIGKNFIQTPVIMKSADGLYISIFEAALVNYPAMCVGIDTKSYTLTSTLAPDAVGNKAYLQTPAKTPWRTVMATEKAPEILASKMILNLNEPCAIKDVSWIKPQKFVGVWWELHVGKSTWNYSDTGNVQIGVTDWAHLKPNGRHGATTARTKTYIDFAAKNGMDGVLVEGWNVGWEDWFGHWKENVFDFVTAYPDFDVAELEKYAAEKGVKMIMHHETSASVTNYERRLDSAYRFMKAYGYDAVKTGYVGRIIPRGELHDGQWMVNHYLRVAQKTAEYKILLDAHEPVRPTGLQRTYPNWLACEAARGNEYNAWSKGNHPDHETILPFTRLLGGPMDYTPGIFQIKLDYYDPKKSEQVHTTLVKQLALYVTMYSPLQMAADLPENYERFPDAFQFIRDVALDWDDTKILEAEPGDFITIARKAKHRTDEWFLGAITDEHARTSSVALDFLTPGLTYAASVYADAPDADWQKNPMAYRIGHVLVTNKSVLDLKLAPGGGAAVSLRPATEEEKKSLQPLK